jgi:neopullulanase
MIGFAPLRGESVNRLPRFFVCLAILFIATAAPTLLPASPPQTSSAAEVTKVEPPNWWIGVTPEVLLLLSGHGLEATHVGCNLPTVRVMHTQATAGGDYLFVWLKIGPTTRSGTAVCRITTPAGPTSFELPLADRAATSGKFQGLANNEIPQRDENDLRAIREHLPQLKKQGMTLLWLAPQTTRDADSGGIDHAVVDFYELDPRRGSLRELKDLVSSAHEQQIKVAFDLALIHINSDHPWVAKPPLAEWLGAPPSNVGTLLKRSPSPSRPGRILDTENPMVALYLRQNTIWWIESSGVDGIRVSSDPHTTSQFWANWRAHLQRIYPHLSIIPESPHPH